MPVSVRQSISLKIVIPVYNEQDNVLNLYRSLVDTLAGRCDRLEFVFVDDGSTDKSWQVLEQLASEHEGCTSIRFTRNFGKEAAIRAGLREAGDHEVVVMDADGQHPPACVLEMLQKWENSNAWIVEGRKSGSRRRGFLSGMGAWFTYGLFKLLTGMEFEGRSDFCLLDRRIVEIVNNLPERVSFFRGMIAWMGFPGEVVYFEVPPRQCGKSKWSLSRLISMAVDMITGFTALPLSVMTIFSGVFLMICSGLIFQTLYNYFFNNAVEGFTTVIICILFVGAVLAAGLGIIGQYIARIYEEVKHRPVYFVEKVAKQNSFED